MANTKLAQAAPGTVVKLNENGVPVEFYIGAQNYEPTLNGPGRALFVRKTCTDKRQWNSANTNTYNSSTLDTYFTGPYVAMLDPDVQASMGATKFYYTPGGGNNTVTTLEKPVFTLSATELGLSHSYANVEGTELPIASILRTVEQWTRSPNTSNPQACFYATAAGALAAVFCTGNYGPRPCFTLPAADWELTEDGTLVKASAGTAMFIPASELEQGVEYYFRIFPRNYQNQFQTGIDGSRLHMVVQDGNEAVADDSAPTEIVPSYTGNSQIFGDGIKGYIELYDSGVLTFNTDVTVDMFLVGAGAGGSSYTSGSSDVSNSGGGGAGSGYTKTLNNISFSKGTEYAVTIGAGGTGGNRSGGASVTPGTAGGSTSVDTYSANGGSPGGTNSSGGNGGSGGGSGGKEMGSRPGSNGGSNGSNGGQVTPTYPGGTGQGTTTHEFMDTQKRLFAGGGGGGGYRTTAAGKGGDGGGGDGGSSSAAAQAGQANTGGGGGGSGSYSGKGGNGGSGIAIIRWGDWTATA